MTENHEQDRTEERETTARPVTAAARRERRAAARGEAGPGRRNVEDKVPTGARSRRARPTDVDGAKPAPARPAAKTLSKEEQGIRTPKRDRQERQPSVLARLVRFIREVIAELRKVIWPTRKQQLTYTIVVLVFVAVVVAFVSGLDLGFAKAVFAIFA